MSNFKIGEKVVCVDENTTFESTIKENEIYTIRDILHNGGIILEEVFSGVINTAWYGYQPLRFRKLDYEFAENLLKEISESVNQKHLQN